MSDLTYAFPLWKSQIVRDQYLLKVTYSSTLKPKYKYHARAGILVMLYYHA